MLARRRPAQWMLGLWVVVWIASVSPVDAQIYSWRDTNGTLVLSDRPQSADATTVEVAGTNLIRATRPIARPTPADTFASLISRHATQLGVRPELVRAVIQVESGFNANARSPDGAMGLMQLMPQTASDLGVDDPYDPDANVRGGVTYLRQLLTRYDENETLALAAYNAGPGAVSRFGNQVPPYPETIGYVKRIADSTRLGQRPRRRGSGTTIYKGYETLDGKQVPVYTNAPSTIGDFEVAVP